MLAYLTQCTTTLSCILFLLGCSILGFLEANFQALYLCKGSMYLDTSSVEYTHTSHSTMDSLQVLLQAA